VTPRPRDPVPQTRRDGSPAPAAFHLGAAHLIMHGNPAFVARYGASAVGQPARETMLDLPRVAFALLDRVIVEGRPLARTVDLPDGPRRLVVAPRVDPESGEVYGVTTHLAPAPG
jgi:hypothetical protein